MINGRKYHPQDLEWSVEQLPGVKRGRVSRLAPASRIARSSSLSQRGTVPAAALSADIRRVVGDVFGLPVGDVVLVASGTIDRTTSGKVRRAAVRASYVGVS
mgnify:CR=1 FL=1